MERSERCAVRGFPYPYSRSLQASRLPTPNEGRPGITGLRARGRPSGPEPGSRAHRPADSKRSPQPRPHRALARLPAGGCAHQAGPGDWRARGAVRGAAGAGWGGGGAGAGAGRGLQPMVPALSQARGAGGGRLGTGRSWQRAALGAHRRSSSGSALAPLGPLRLCHWPYSGWNTAWASSELLAPVSAPEDHAPGTPRGTRLG